MAKPEYNIEFGHIYVDEEFGEEQLQSIVKLKEIMFSLAKNNLPS